MKIEIELDDVDILDSYEDYNKEYSKVEAIGHRRWGRITWLYPGEFIAQITAESAATIKRALELESIIKKAEQNEKEKTK